MSRDLIKRLVQRLVSHEDLDARDHTVLKDARTALAQLDLFPGETKMTNANKLIRELAHALLAVDCHSTTCNKVKAFQEDVSPHSSCDCYMKKRDEVLALLRAAGRLT